jgi:hypothetical protein
MTKRFDNFSTAEVAVVFLGIIALIALVAILEGWLVTIVVGYFGYHLTIFQGWVTAITVSMITGGWNWKSK